MSCEWFIQPPPACECCGRAFEPVRIGTSAIGWAFGFDEIDGQPGTMEAWRPHLAGKTIVDEYDRTYSAEEFEKFVARKANLKRGLA